MVPPLNPRPRELAVSNLTGDCRGLIRRKSHPADCLFTHRRCQGDALPGAVRAVIVSCTGRARESGGAPWVRRPFPAPACPGAWTGPGRILAFLPCQVLTTAAWLL